MTADRGLLLEVRSWIARYTSGAGTDDIVAKIDGEIDRLTARLAQPEPAGVEEYLTAAIYKIDCSEPSWADLSRTIAKTVLAALRSRSAGASEPVAYQVFDPSGAHVDYQERDLQDRTLIVAGFTSRPLYARSAGATVGVPGTAAAVQETMRRADEDPAQAFLRKALAKHAAPPAPAPKGAAAVYEQLWCSAERDLLTAKQILTDAVSYIQTGAHEGGEPKTWLGDAAAFLADLDESDPPVPAPVAGLEPRGCPTPGACSCPAPVAKP